MLVILHRDDLVPLVLQLLDQIKLDLFLILQASMLGKSNLLYLLAMRLKVVKSAMQDQRIVLLPVVGLL